MTMRKFGYSRVSSSKGQVHDRQEAALKAEGIPASDIYYDSQSGKDAERKGLQTVLRIMHPGDMLVVTELSRLGRSVRDLSDICTQLNDNGIQLKSLKEEINTHTPAGRLVFHTLSAIAEFERDIIRQRQAEGIALAKARGAYLGTQPKLNDSQVRQMKQYREKNNMSVPQLANLYKVSKSTIYRYLKA